MTLRRVMVMTLSCIFELLQLQLQLVMSMRCKLNWGASLNEVQVKTEDQEGGPNNSTHLCDLLLNPAESMNQWDEKNQKIKRMNKYIIINVI